MSQFPARAANRAPSWFAGAATTGPGQRRGAGTAAKFMIICLAKRGAISILRVSSASCLGWFVPLQRGSGPR